MLIIRKIFSSQFYLRTIRAYLSTIRDKERLKLEQKKKKIEDEKQNLEQIQHQLIQDNQKQQTTDLVKKQKFKEGIEEGKHEKNTLKLYEKEQKLTENPNQYFPFTHGDHIERQREYLKQELKEDLQRLKRATSTVGQSRRSDNRQYKNETDTIVSHHSSVSQHGMRKTLYPVGDNKQEALREKFAQEYPNFIKPHKFVKITIKRKPDENMVNDALMNARSRFESQLLNQKLQNQEHLAEQQKQIKPHRSIQKRGQDKRFYDDMEKQKKQQMLENRRILERQMEEERHRKYMDKNEIKVPTNTTYGPQQTEEISQLLMDKKLVEQDNMKQILMEQMKGKSVTNYSKAHEKQKLKDRELEIINLNNVTKVIEDTQSAEKKKIRDQKEKYKVEWLDQASLNNKSKIEQRVL